MDDDEVAQALAKVIEDLAAIRGSLDQLAGVVRRLLDTRRAEQREPGTVHPIRPGEDGTQ